MAGASAGATGGGCAGGDSDGFSFFFTLFTVIIPLKGAGAFTFNIIIIIAALIRDFSSMRGVHCSGDSGVDLVLDGVRVRVTHII